MTRPLPSPDRGSLRLAARLIRSYLRGEVAAVTAGVVALLISASLALLEPWPLKIVVDSVLGDLPPPPAVAWLLDRTGGIFGGMAPLLRLLSIMCLTIVGLRIALGAARLSADFFLIGAGLRMVFRLRCAVFDHVQRLSLVFHDRTPIGDSLYRVAWDTYSIQTLFNSTVIHLLTAITTVGGIAWILFQRDWVLSLVALAFGLPVILVLRRVDGPIRHRSLAASEHESAVTSRVQETLAGIRVVQAFSAEAREADRFRERAAGSARATLRLNLAQSASGLVVGLVLATGTAVVIWVSSSRVLAGSLTAGDVVLIAAYVAMLYKPFEAFAFTATTIQHASSGAKRVFEILDTNPDVGNRRGASRLEGRVSGRVTFEDVSFAYAGGRTVLDGLSFDIAPGSRVALVGASGVGKTTVASLLVRFYDPTSGRILIDGADIRTLDLAALRSQIAVVLQDPILFGTTVRENIAYGRPAASLDEIVTAARAAGADGFIAALPDGYESHVGERGGFLSGGQRQRLAIARAFLKDAPVLLMDEPTSALDAATEATLLSALDVLMRGRTSIVIAHRLSTIRHADRILVFRDGRVIESGTHDELLDRRGNYADLYARQFRAAEPLGASA